MTKLFKFDFDLDDFQQEAVKHIEGGNSVVVCAPTGAGKTVIAEYAINIAIKENKRVFYTTPLKALSNQKFRDFQKALGEDKVGLLTGDISINRDSPVVVMTTEVFRNMLYGTALGKIEDNLKNVMVVVLDECHYMNDKERGTVWEESIIYCPQNIQIIALSATIANSQQLTDWINNVHGNAKLVNSDFRPVPLRNFYFINNQLIPLIAPGGKINQKIKRMRYQKIYDKKRKHAQVMQLIKILHAKDMLPAIYFCFSRKRCDEYLEQCSYLRLLTEFEERRLAQIIDEHIEENPSLAKHKHLEYIYSGVASHHAGLLPGWKVLIERLFQQGLIKVVFATETLAAGINMPARTTIISDISKRTDDGHRELTASEFLQMSGRAGRRGMDKIGYVVTLATPYHSCTEVFNLAMSDADPLNSQFTPTYSMVLNLLQRFTLNQARELILSSFGYYNSKVRLAPLLKVRKEINEKIKESSDIVCSHGLTNEELTAYQKNKEKLVEMKRLFNTLKKQKKHYGHQDIEAEIKKYKDQCAEVLSKIEKTPCYTCGHYNKHIKTIDVLRRYNKKLDNINQVIEVEKDIYWKQFLNLINVLSEFGYLKDNYPTELGITASHFRTENELFMVEVLNSGYLDNLTPPELAAIFCALISEEPRNNGVIRMHPSKNVRKAINDIYSVLKKVQRAQRKNNVICDLLLNIQLSGATETWASEAEWETVVAQTSMDEGDIVRTIKRTVDIMRQVVHAPYINPDLTQNCDIALKAIYREPIVEIL